MKRCPSCGELLLDWVEVCPICGNRLTDDSIGEIKFTVSKKVSVNVDHIDIIPSGLYRQLPSIMDIKLRNKTHYEVKVKVYAEIEDVTEKYEEKIKLGMFEEKELNIRPSLKKGIFSQLNKEKECQLKYGIDVENGERWVKSVEVLVLPYRDMPWIIGGKYIAAWVTPREKLIEGMLLRDAAEEIEKLAGIEGAICGHQNGIEYTILQLWGVYNALKNYGIRYISTPLSLFKEYQRIRLPKEVIEEESGNCIELAITFASAIEAANMYPAIILFENHAIAGVILPAKIEEENELLRTINENLIHMEDYPIIPVETTLIPSEDFLIAVEKGKEEMETQEIKDIIFIPEARNEGIQPMDVWLE